MVASTDKSKKGKICPCKGLFVGEGQRAIRALYFVGIATTDKRTKGNFAPCKGALANER